MTEADPDYVVVGAGAAGCVVASRLAERGFAVTLLEAGGRDTNPLFRIPGLGFTVTLQSAYNWNFRTEPVPALGGRELTFLQGRVVGGSSSINGMMYNRGHPQEYDGWRQLGCRGWTYPELHAYFERSEARLAGVAGRSAGTALSRSAETLPIFDAILEAAREKGYPVLENVLSGDEGIGLFHTNVVAGRRVSAATAYLRPALKAGRLRLHINALAGRVLIEDGQATGVELVGPQGTQRLLARREVILCAGGIKSPQLLLLSGVGPAGELQEAGIAVVADAPNVGRNLQNHASYRMQFTCRDPVSAYRYARPLPAIGQAVRYAVSRKGILAQTIFGAGGHLRSSPDLEAPDLQVVFSGALNPAPTGGGLQFLKMLPRQEGFTAIVYQGTPFSTGRVSLASADAAEPPRIQPNYFSDPRDIDVLIAGIRQVRTMASAPALSRLGIEEVAPGMSADNDADLAQAIRDGASTAFHQSGTCAMGGQDDAVVDPQLRVRGVGRLRVADASIIPRILNAGLHGPSLMIGEKAADMIIQAAH